MNILLISTNTLPAAPTGPAYIAGAALRAGHSVEIFESLFSQNVPTELKCQIERFRPDVIGISIRLVHAYVIDETARYNTRHLDLRPGIKQMVDAIRQVTQAPIILGGPGFNYYARDWLDYLNLEDGIRGEADFSFPLYLDRLAQGGDLTAIPGRVSRQNGKYSSSPRDCVENLDDTAFPAYPLMDVQRYQQHGISPGILTKRGCAFQCTYCPYASLEGTRYRLKSPARVVDEIEYIVRTTSPKMVTFCENNFNVPKKHAAAICQEIIARKLDVRWGSGDLRPMGIDDDFCRLMRDSGCGYVSLSIESGSDAILRRMRRGYSVADIEQSLNCLERSGIPFGASLMIGAPGESPETVRETLAFMDRFSIPLGTWMTIGLCLWTPRQGILADARQAGQLLEDRMLFEGANYLSPDLPRSFMEDLIAAYRSRKGYTVQANQPYAGYRWENG